MRAANDETSEESDSSAKSAHSHLENKSNAKTDEIRNVRLERQGEQLADCRRLKLRFCRGALRPPIAAGAANR